jgi:hypothetical protein
VILKYNKSEAVILPAQTPCYSSCLRAYLQELCGFYCRAADGVAGVTIKKNLKAFHNLAMTAWTSAGV